VDKVADGTRLVDASGKALEEIVQGVKKVSDIVAEIAAASQEQSSGIEQINKAISQMDEVTQQNASLVEEAASASESMDAQARVLMKQMEFFKIRDGRTDRQDYSPVSVKPAAMAAKPAQERPAKTSVRPPAMAKQLVASKTNGKAKETEWTDF
jgi:methyl-accepting chemotaxis protein